MRPADGERGDEHRSGRAHGGSVDLLQIGARNMQNFDLLKAVGKCERPVLIKRGMAASIDELLAAAEYILSKAIPT